MPRIVEPEDETQPAAPDPEEELSTEYEDDELDNQESKSDFGGVPSESKAWMRNLRRIKNLLEDSKNTINRMKKQQEERPTANDLLADYRVSSHDKVYRMERNWLEVLGVLRSIESTHEAIRQETDTLDQELRSMKIGTVKR